MNITVDNKPAYPSTMMGLEKAQSQQPLWAWPLLLAVLIADKIADGPKIRPEPPTQKKLHGWKTHLEITSLLRQIQWLSPR